MRLFSAKCTSTVRLDGKTAVITGCNTGIGKMTVLDFYKRGTDIMIDKGLKPMQKFNKSCFNNKIV